jgi:outer membrane protein OmpA-like peptidoglycan-associated protein
MKSLGAVLFIASLSACTAPQLPGDLTGNPQMQLQNGVQQMNSQLNLALKRAAQLSTTPGAVQSDPTFIPFDKMSVKLAPSGAAQLVALAPALKLSHMIVVRGYCYRKDIGNAKEAARARAMAVRDFLVSGGIDKSYIEVRIDTDKPLHAVRISFSS